MRGSMNPKAMLAVLWLAAASVGLLVAAVPYVDEDPSARLLAVLLVAASLPFGLLRPSVPALWAVALAWPTVVIRLSQESGWQAIVLLVYPLVGVYSGDWIATWWAERHPKAVRRDESGSATGAQTAADGTAVDTDGLPPAMPGRWTRAARRAEEEARHDTGPAPESGSVTGLRP